MNRSLACFLGLLIVSVLVACGGPRPPKTSTFPPKGVNRAEGMLEGESIPSKGGSSKDWPPEKNFSGIFNDSDFDKVFLQVQSCPTTFSIGGNIGELSLRKLSGNKNLVYLGLSDCADDKSITVIESLPKLQSLFIANSAITDAGCARLAKLPKIHTLAIFNAPISSEGIRHFGSMDNLRSLTLSNLYLEINNEALRNLKNLRQLTELRITTSNEKNGHLITDDGLAHLSGLSGLQTLSIQYSKILGEGIKQLVGLQDLAHLDLKGNPVTDDAIPHLLELPKLGWLDLSDSRVSLKGTEKLRRRFPEAWIKDRTGRDFPKKSEEGTKRPYENLARAIPDFTISAETLMKEIKTDQTASEKKYHGKVLLVEGKVGNYQSHAEIVCNGFRAPGFFFGKDEYDLACETVHPTPWVITYPGQKIQIQGRLKMRRGDEFGNNYLESGVFLNLEKNVRTSISAVELSKYARADKDAAQEKCGKSPLLVRGKIEKLDISLNRTTTLYLTGHENYPLKIWCGHTGSVFFRFEVGDEIEGRQEECNSETNTSV